MVAAARDQSHIRPEVHSEVSAFLEMRADLLRLEQKVRAWFERRMQHEGLTAAEYRLVIDALDRKE